MKGSHKYFTFIPQDPTDPIDEDMHRKCDMTRPHHKSWEWEDGQILNWIEYYGESEYEFNDQIFKEKNIAIKMNYDANPYFKETSLVTEMLNDRENLPYAEYLHIWHGEYLRRTDSIVFDQSKIKVWDFEEHSNTNPYYGVDWGYIDPTAGVRLYVRDNQLWITHECGGSCLSESQIIQELESLPSIKLYTSRGDCADAGKIAMCNRNGFRMIGCKKNFGSKGAEKKGFIETGISFIRNFDQINVNSSCKNVIKELSLYSYKVDKKTDEVKNELEDDNNHWIDAMRYALEPLIKNSTAKRVKVIY